MEKFICEHCGHRFESEPVESIVCPNCSWSTSVKKEEAERPKIVTPKAAPPSRPQTSSASSAPPRPFVLGGGALLILVLVGVAIFAAQHLLKQDQIIQKIESKNADEIASQAPELALLPAEQEVLNRKISLETDRPLTEAEKQTVNRRIPLRSRSVRGLPTPPWDELQFEAFLKSQELQYKLPLEWSYRRKLKSIFKLHYVAAAAAFDEKDHLKSRDEWIRSLAIPVYKNNIQKHRGVILTMLRPYINDTLSRIGLLSALLTEKESSAEERVKENYAALLELLQNQSWEEANAKLLEIQKDLESLEKTGQAAPAAPPPLPPEINQVDADIREVLLSQAAPSQWMGRDWEVFRQDLLAKERVVQGHLPATFEAVRSDYHKALSFIESGNWAEARELLQKIQFPPELVEDARAKIEILNKLIPPAPLAAESLDSQEKTR